MAFRWYIVHVYSGFEGKVKQSLEDRIATSPHPEKFKEVLLPTEEVVELVKGKRKTTSRKFYPGYILVRMELDEETWHIVNDTAKVTGFLGGKEADPHFRRGSRANSQPHGGRQIKAPAQVFVRAGG